MVDLFFRHMEKFSGKIAEPHKPLHNPGNVRNKAAGPDKRAGPDKDLGGDDHGKDACCRCGGPGVGKGRPDDGFRRTGRCNQPALLRYEEAGQHPPHSGPACGRRLAHGGRLHPGQGRQHRSLHRDFGTGRDRYDHRALFRQRRLDSDSLHHRAGAARQAGQRGLSGGRHRRHRRTGDQVGRDGHGTLPGADGDPEGLPPDALQPAGSCPGRPAGGRADGRDRLRHRHLRAPADLQARGHAAADREGAGDAERVRSPCHRRRRRHHQRRCFGPAGGLRRGDRHPGDSHPDGLGHDPRRP